MLARRKAPVVQPASARRASVNGPIAAATTAREYTPVYRLQSAGGAVLVEQVEKGRILARASIPESGIVKTIW
jgi:hypothetical protein